MTGETDSALPQSTPPPRLLPLAGLFWLPLLGWWVALLPGSWSMDSINSWNQIQTGHWDNHHPIPFTAFMWLTSAGGHVPATVPLAQTVLVAVSLAMLVRSIVRAFGGGRAPVVVGLLLCVLPLLGPLAVDVWKDIPELAAVLVLQSLLLDATDRAGPRRATWWILLAGSTLTAALMRWNGAGTVVVAALVALFAIPRVLRWRVALATVAVGAIGLTVLATAPKWSSVPPVSAADTRLEQLADLADVANTSPDWLTPEARDAMTSVAPLGAWARQGRQCATSSFVRQYLIAAHHREPLVERAKTRLDKAWWSLFRSHPGAVLKLRLCRSALAWSPVELGGIGLHTVWTGVVHNRYGIADGGWPPLHRAAVRVIGVTRTVPAHVLAWRPALWVLTLAVLVLAAWRRPEERARRLVLLAVPAGVLVSYAVAPAGQSARYTYAAVVICQLTLTAIAQQWVASRQRAPR